MKKISLWVISLTAILLLSGCTNGNIEEESVPKYLLKTLLKSEDGGETWKSNFDLSTDRGGKTSISPNILAIEYSLLDNQRIYLGTEAAGLYLSDNGGTDWEKLEFPLTKIYGLSVARVEGGDLVYASGIWKNRGKIFRKNMAQDQEWAEVYSEPADNSGFISSLRASSRNPNLVYAGNNAGMIIKSTDGGNSWKNLHKASGAVTNIQFDPFDDNRVYFVVFDREVLYTQNGGNEFKSLNDSLKNFKFKVPAFSLATDPATSGLFYAGLDDGIVRGSNYGEKVERVNIIESSKKYPIRSLLVNPKNQNEIVYNSAQAMYKSINKGATWSVTQLETDRFVQVIRYDPENTQNIYLGLRKN